MPVYTDQTGNTISVPATPGRIISLVPSQTELLFDLGLDEEITGITKFCVHPSEWRRRKEIVGGTKQLKLETIHSLQPDLIIANKEENVKEQIAELSRHYPVWISDVADIEDAYRMIKEIGKITGKNSRASTIINTIQNEFANFESAHSHFTKRTCCYLIWQKPYMTVGRDTFIHAMLEKAGLINVFGNRLRYPSITIEEIKAAKPAVVLLSSEPFPFKQKHADEFAKYLPGSKVLVADGEMFSWYGSRLLRSCHYFKELLSFI